MGLAELKSPAMLERGVRSGVPRNTSGVLTRVPVMACWMLKDGV